MRQNISSNTKWEGIAGYSRAVKVGNLVYVSGTTATDDDGNVVGAGSVYEQTAFVIRKIEKALHQAGARLQDVVRTRIFITDASRWEEATRAHFEFFGDIRPANTLVEISALIGPEYLVEMEVDAVIGAGEGLA